VKQFASSLASSANSCPASKIVTLPINAMRALAARAGCARTVIVAACFGELRMLRLFCEIGIKMKDNDPFCAQLDHRVSSGVLVPAQGAEGACYLA
jgi:hypothetical protein